MWPYDEPDVSNLIEAGDVGGLIDALNRCGDPDSRRRALRALGELGGDEALEGIHEYLVTQSSWYSGGEACELAKELSGTKAVDDLIGWLETGHSVSAADILGWTGDPRAVQPLISLLRHPSENARAEAAQALGRLRARKAVDTLIRHLGHPDQVGRSRVFSGWTEPPEPWVGDLSGFDIVQDRWYVRRRVAEALGTIGDRRAVDALIAALQDSDEEVRARAARALGRLGDPKALHALIAALEDTDSYVRAASMEALRELGGEEVAMALAQDRSRSVEGHDAPPVRLGATCFYCQEPAQGYCRSCGRFYCRSHGSRGCHDCAAHVKRVKGDYFDVDVLPFYVGQFVPTILWAFTERPAGAGMGNPWTWWLARIDWFLSLFGLVPKTWGARDLIAMVMWVIGFLIWTILWQYLGQGPKQRDSKAPKWLKWTDHELLGAIRGPARWIGGIMAGFWFWPLSPLVFIGLLVTAIRVAWLYQIGRIFAPVKSDDRASQEL
jgi:HEAT repeat protein